MSWFLAFLGFALLVILHEAGHFMAAKAVGMRVERFSLFFPPLLARRRVGETEYAIGAVPLGGYVKISGMNPDEKLPPEVRDRAYHAQPVWKRMVVIAAGPGMNLVLALLLLLAYFWFIGPRTVGVDQVQAGYPAHAQLRTGDRIVAVDGHAGGPTRAASLIAAHRCAQSPPSPRCVARTPARVTIERGGRRMTLALRPIYDPATKRMRLGFRYGDTGPRRTEPLGKAAGSAISSFGYIAGKTVTLPAKFFSAKQRKQIHGVVGSYESTRQTIVHDTPDVIGVLAVISLALAIVNLFPFLPLDGGHIFWAAVEKVRRRPVPLWVMERSGVVGFALVIVVFIIGFTNDINTLTGKGFQVR
ncbi:MAG: site-2 protease family protein [Actinobacteria bacterium]|nr:site-2 protease family protein [Actinomycetota bacterium]